jgi:hypothetical protein
MKTEQIPRKLNRYTTLPVLLDLLRRKKILLLDPSTWEDRNDAEVILEYKRQKRVPNLFAICFSIGDETIHHWKAYADGISGCCIEFDGIRLLESFQGMSGFRWGHIEYKKIREVETMELDTDRIPFIKRKPYRFEEEFRILWEGKTDQTSMDVDIELDAINKVTISQKMPSDVCASMKELLRHEIRDQSLKINTSTLYKNNRWIKAFKKQA